MTARGFATAASLATLAMLAACGGGGSPTATATPTPTATATGGSGSQTTFSYNVEPCFTQQVPGTGLTVRQMLQGPDALDLDLSKPANFPNGRDLDDPVADITIAFLFLDLTESGQSLRTFANLPLNPPASDRAPLTVWPFLAPPQGTPQLAATTGTAFNFRTDPDAAYTQVDRMGMPAVTAVLIGSAQRNAYNDASASADTAGMFRAEETAQLNNLMLAIGDDLVNIGLDICATRTVVN